MRTLLISSLAAAALLCGGCSTIDKVFGGSSVIEQAAPSERPALRVIAASLVVKGAYETVGEQLDRGRLTAGEARRIKEKIDVAAGAVDIAGRAIEAGGADSALIAMDEAIDAILTSGLIKGE